MTRPVDIVRKVCPRARQSYLAAFEHGDGQFRHHGITTPLRLAHFLAQCLHESGGLTLEWESGAYSANRLVEIFGVGRHSACVTETEAAGLAYNGAAIFERVYGLGNPKKAMELGNADPGDGFKYRGGGIMQTTGRANYRRMGKRCGVDFEKHPELVLSAAHALKPALAEWTEGKLNEAADRDDIRAITRRINGGYNGLADRQAWFAKVRPLIDKVDLIEAAVVTPAPPDIVPTPKPRVPARNATAGAGAVAAILAAMHANTMTTALVIAALGIAIAVAVYFLWPKKKV